MVRVGETGTIPYNISQAELLACFSDQEWQLLLRRAVMVKKDTVKGDQNGSGLWYKFDLVH